MIEEKNNYKSYLSSRTQPNVAKYKSEYEVKQHAIFTDYARYPDRQVTDETTDEMGRKRSTTSIVPLNRIGLPFQREISQVASIFLFSNPVVFINQSPDSAELFEVFQSWVHRERLQYLFKELSTLCSIYTEAALFLYPQESNESYYNLNSSTRVVVKLLSPEEYEFHPVFDENGDLKSFGRKFKRKDGVYFEAWTNEYMKLFKNGDLIEEKPNIINKIPFVFVQYEKNEWEDVQSAIERLEAIYSNVAESNDRFAFPILKMEGTVIGQMSNDKSGRVLELTEGADANFITHPTAPQSLDDEITRLIKLIRGTTATPDFSMENLISVANVIASGNASSLFIAPQMKAMERIPIYYVAFSRLASLAGSFFTQIEPSFANQKLNIEAQIQPFEMKTKESIARFAMELSGGASLWSQRYAMKKIGVKDSERMIEEIQEETQKKNAIEL